jgi:hypothetical protein
VGLGEHIDHTFQLCDALFQSVDALRIRLGERPATATSEDGTKDGQVLKFSSRFHGGILATQMTLGRGTKTHSPLSPEQTAWS